MSSCCVFSRQFPLRRTPAGGFVSTYDHLVSYLMAKHPSIKRAKLDFDGKNHVLYCCEYDDSVAAQSDMCMECNVDSSQDK